MIHAWRISVIMVIVYKVSAAGVNKDPLAPSTVPLPSFLATRTNFTFREGELARLECSVDNLSTKKVIWRRKSDPNPLTIGKRTFVEDTRVLVEHAPLQREWNLLIKHVRIDDAGMYECQVSSRHKRLRWLVRLNVLRGKKNPGSTEDGKSQGLNTTDDIVITGAKYVEKDSPIKLTCNATGEDHAPDEIDWFKNGDKLETNYARQIYIQKRVSLTTKTILSILEIKKAKMDDAGMYICRTSDLQITSKRVNVLNAGTSNVKRGTEKDNDAMLVGGRGSSGRSVFQSASCTSCHAVVLVILSAVISELLETT